MPSNAIKEKGIEHSPWVTNKGAKHINNIYKRWSLLIEPTSTVVHMQARAGIMQFLFDGVANIYHLQVRG